MKVLHAGTPAVAMALALSLALAPGMVAAQGMVAAAGPCEGRALCEHPGPFAVEIVRSSAATDRGNHRIRVVMRVRNTGAEPLVLGYVRGSGTMDDDRGNRYEVDWRYREHVSGIGVVERRAADARFVLAPGASRDFSLVYSRYIGKNPGLGQVYSPSLSLAQLEPLSAEQVRTVTDYSLNFAGMKPGGLAAVAGDELGRLLGEWLDRGRK